jgi:CMP-N,N'-diacetyllegionaminic acid synthase
VVSSDDPRVLEIAREYPSLHPLERPAELATDTAPAIAYVRHALDTLGESFDAFCIVQPSSPLTLSSDVDGTVELLERTGAETAVSVVELDHAVHPFKMKVMDGDRLLPFLEEEKGRMAAHELPKIFVRNCSVYVSRLSVLDAYGAVVGADQRGYVMPPERSIDINVELDLVIAEVLLSRGGAIRAG